MYNDEDYMQDHVETSKLATNATFLQAPHRSVNYPAFNSFIHIFGADTLAE